MKTRTRRLRKKSGGLTGPDPTDQTTTVPTGPTGPTVPTGLTGPTTGSTTDNTSPFAAPPVPDKPDNNIPGRPPVSAQDTQSADTTEKKPGFLAKFFNSNSSADTGILGKLKGLFSGGKCKRSKKSKKSKRSKRTKKSKKSKK